MNGDKELHSNTANSAILSSRVDKLIQDFKRLNKRCNSIEEKFDELEKLKKTLECSEKETWWRNFRNLMR